MSKCFPHMYDSPEKSQAVASLSCGAVSFLLLPFTFTLFFYDRNPYQVYMVLEYLYQGINFVMMAMVFHSYLRDSWLNVSIAPKSVIGVSLGAAAAIIVLYLFYLTAGILDLFPQSGLIFLGVLPMAGVELMLLPGDLVLFSGIPAMVFLVVLGPIITSCMFYATAFAPVCVSGKRFGAYGAVALMLALPRIITYFTAWGGWKELPLYLAQLPIHLIACWTYQKTDTIWAPIFTHAIVNLFACGMLFLLHATGIVG